MTCANSERLRVLAAFLRSQAWLTDKRPHESGPGDVHLNHEEALLAADAIEELLALTVGRVVER
jgi:hypothetical protein